MRGFIELEYKYEYERKSRSRSGECGRRRKQSSCRIVGESGAALREYDARDSSDRSREQRTEGGDPDSRDSESGGIKETVQARGDAHSWNS